MMLTSMRCVRDRGETQRPPSSFTIIYDVGRCHSFARDRVRNVIHLRAKEKSAARRSARRNTAETYHRERRERLTVRDPRRPVTRARARVRIRVQDRNYTYTVSPCMKSSGRSVRRLSRSQCSNRFSVPAESIDYH